MTIQLKHYTEQLKEWPKEGHHIMAQYNNEKIVVYQSYRPEIGHFASQNQYFGGLFSLDRMTWIKPNFLWMMYRNGWGTKPGQEVVLAIHLKREAFQNYLEHAVYSSYQANLYNSKEEWQNDVKHSNVRLQWDPDHDPYGHKQDRRAIQIGLRQNFIASYSKDDILKIEDISDFVSEQYNLVKENRLNELIIPEERPFIPNGVELQKRLQLK